MGKIKSIFPFFKAPNSHLRDKQSSRAVLAVQKKKKKKKATLHFQILVSWS